MNSTAYDIIILAGQSNAVGYGCGEADYALKHIDRVSLLYDDQPEDYSRDENGKEFLDVREPWRITLTPAEKGYTGSLALRFADEYIERGLLEHGRKILIVRCAVGGTGFCKGLWGVGQLLYRRMLDLTRFALDLHPDSRAVAFLWHQGECDAYENPDWDPLKKRVYYRDNLNGVISGVRSFVHDRRLPFLCGGFTDDWSKDYSEHCDAIVKALKQVCEGAGCAEYIDTKGLMSNDGLLHNGDTIHFCKQSVYEIGLRYFESYLKIIKNSVK